MKLSLKQAIKIYGLMQENGVVLYGAGKEGMLALHTLEREGIKIHEIADQQVGKSIGNRHTVSIETLYELEDNEVCIITPRQKLPKIYERLKEHFDIVIDNFVIHWIAYFYPRDMDELEYMKSFPFNHYESPYSQNNELEIFRRYRGANTISDLKINIDAQLNFLSKLAVYGCDFLEKKAENKFRYRSDNTFFNDGDAVLLHSIIREYKPHRIIEIGSGFSTCVMLDTKEYWVDCAKIQVTCIEPYPERLYSNIKNFDEINIKNTFVQNVDLCEFESLEANDIVFIDSSHVIRTGGDVPFEIFEILPRLRSGVLIHFHDIFYPFTYPEKWILEGRAYNEAYILRALLMNSDAYEIVFWNDFMAATHSGQISENSFLGGGSLWIRKR